MEVNSTHIKVFRIVQASWLLCWFCKISFYARYLFHIAPSLPVEHSLFPSIFLNPKISAVFYVLPLWSLITFISNNKNTYRRAAGLMMISAAVMLMHINTYNDATFVVAFWVALWLFWLSGKLDADDAFVGYHGRVLAQCLLGMVFLAGTVGKLTPEYLEGTVFYNIFLAQGTLSPLHGLLGGLSQEAQRAWVGMISKGVIVSEGLLALSAFLPYVWVCVLVVVTLPMIMLFSTWKILSVIGPLLVLILACSLWGQVYD